MSVRNRSRNLKEAVASVVPFFSTLCKNDTCVSSRRLGRMRKAVMNHRLCHNCGNDLETSATSCTRCGEAVPEGVGSDRDGNLSGDPTVPHHLSDADLLGYLQQEISAAAAERVESHVEGCAECQCRLEALTPDLDDVLSGSASQDETKYAAVDDLELPRFGPYVAKQEIGRGGFGTVYLATHDEAGHQVAIKVGDRLMEEARTLVLLSQPNIVHPNIVRVLFVGEDAHNRPYLVMDYMQGGSLRDRLKKGDPLTPLQGTRIALQISEALHTAHTHANQIIHRDLKPENVLFDDEGDDANALVADFGLALTEADQVGRRGDYSGTLPYQSPEQIRGEADWIDARSDLWALGVILYEMLTGRRPFSGDDLRDQILHKLPKPPRQFNERIPEGLEAICLKCLEKDARHRYQTADALARALRGQELGDNPYKGLEAFEEEDCDRFFGRSEQTQRLRDEFVRIYSASLTGSSQPRILAVLGPSGCGKSSLVKAGLLPELRGEQLPGKSEFRVAVFRPRTRPLKSLADVLDRFSGSAEDAGVLRSRNYVKAMQAQDSEDCEGLWWIVDSLPRISDAPLVLVIDQFEEIFTECEDEQERQCFLDNLLHAASQSDGALSVVLTLRSDFLPETQQFERLNEVIANQGLLIPAMKESELREIITLPAKKAGHEFDAAVIDLLVKDSHRRDGALPLLQVVLTRIWDGLREGIEPATTYSQLGGVGGALASAAERVYEGLTAEQQQIARRIFLGMVKLGEGTQDTKRAADIRHLMSYQDDMEVAREVLTRFSSKNSRFITLKRKVQEKADEPNVIQAEMTHEALLEHWQRLRQWIDTSRRDLRFKDRLNEAAQRWDELRRPEGSLWRPPELDVLRQRLSRIEPDLSQLQKEFADASEIHDQEVQAAAEEEYRQKQLQQHRAVRRFKQVATTFCILSVAIFATACWALWQWNDADQQRITAENEKTRAQTQQSRAENAETSLRQSDYFHRMTLAFQEMSRGSGRTFRSLLDAHQGISEFESWEYRWLASRQDSSLATIQAHEGPGLAIAWDYTRERIATVGADGRIRLWDLQDQVRVNASSQDIDVGDRELIRLAWHPRRPLLASCSKDGDVQIWDPEKGTLVRQFTHGENLDAVAWSPLGGILTSSSRDGIIKFWTIDQEDGEIGSHSIQMDESRWSLENQVTHTSLSWHPYSRWLAVSLKGDAHPETIVFLDARKLPDVEPFPHNVSQSELVSRGLHSVAWRPNGDQIAYVTNEGQIYLQDVPLTDDCEWKPDDRFRAEAVALGNHRVPGNVVKQLTWSPNARYLANTLGTSVLQVLDIHRPADATTLLLGHAERINDVAWSRHGDLIASCDASGVLKVWNRFATPHAAPARRFSNWITDIHWNPADPDCIAVCDVQSHVHVLNRRTDVEITMLGQPWETHPRLWCVRWSPTGKRIVAGGHRGEIRVADLDTADTYQAICGQWRTSQTHLDRRITELRWSSDGRFLASVDESGRLAVWDTDTWQVIVVPDRLHGTTCAWHTSAPLLAYPSAEGIQLLDVFADPDAGIKVSKNTIWESSYSDDITAMAWRDSTILLGDRRGFVGAFDSGAPVFPFARYHDGAVRSLAFHPTENRAVSASASNDVLVFDPTSDVGTFRFSQDRGVVSAAGWSSDGKSLAMAGFSQQLTIWDAADTVPTGERFDGAATNTHAYQLDVRIQRESIRQLRDDSLQVYLELAQRLENGNEDMQKMAAHYTEKATNLENIINEDDARLSRDPTTADYLRLADELLHGDMSPAVCNQVVSILTKVIQQQADRPGAYFKRGYAYFQLQNYAEAAADFDRVVELAPNFPDVYHSRAHAKDRLYDDDGVAADFERAVIRNPEYVTCGLSDTYLWHLADVVDRDPSAAHKVLERGRKIIENAMVAQQFEIAAQMLEEFLVAHRQLNGSQTDQSWIRFKLWELHQLHGTKRLSDDFALEPLAYPLRTNGIYKTLQGESIDLAQFLRGFVLTIYLGNSELSATEVRHVEMLRRLYSPKMKVAIIASDESEIETIEQTNGIPGDWKVFVGNSTEYAPSQTLMLCSVDGQVLSMTQPGSQLETRIRGFLGPPFNGLGSLFSIDLTRHANQELDSRFDETGRPNNLAEFPQGKQNFAGIDFSIGDQMIQLNRFLSDEIQGPDRVEGISVKRKLSRLFILHGAQWANLGDGTQIGEYRVHYATGRQESIPIVVGEDVRDWWDTDQSASTGRSLVAWRGQNEASRAEGEMIRVYLSVWENPWPDEVVTSLEFALTGRKDSGPFLIGLTAETSAAD